MEMFLFICLLSCFLGTELLTRVPSHLHTPLMSGSNAISGVVVLAAITAVKSGDAPWIAHIALIFATINVVGGYLVTDRMLRFFVKKRNGN
jgi:NAD(P) transhydrogenase subunit alpha